MKPDKDFLSPEAKERQAQGLSVEGMGLTQDPDAGIPQPLFVTSSWRLPLIQPSQPLANFAPIAPPLTLPCGPHTARLEV